MPIFNIQLESDRLYLRPLIFEELNKYIESPKELAKYLNLNDSHTDADNELKDAVLKEFVPEINHFAKEFLFYTLWLIIRKSDAAVLGSFCFHGEPVSGKIEIGYGLYNEFRNFGYMTEAILRMLEWTKKRSDIQYVFAETEIQNLQSRKVLQKAGFSEIIEENGLMIWEVNV